MNRILAIESSCDETGVAIVEGDGVGLAHVVGEALASQVAIHQEYGGVFPDVAAREHTRRIFPVLGVALYEAGLIDEPTATGEQVRAAIATLDAIAVTYGPGLIGPLLVGTSAAMQLAHLASKPLIPINHWEGHLYSAFLESGAGQLAPTFPLLALTVSGGHTSLILMRDHLEYEILGSTIDDAAGEAFDKTARLLGLPYPGGPEIGKHAALAREKGEQRTLKLPRPLMANNRLSSSTSNVSNFSFSGLKTAVRYAIDRGDIQLPQQLDAAAREIEDAICDVLLGKLAGAIKAVKPTSVAIVGGVSANAELRRRAAIDLPLSPHIALILPARKYSTDNATMIGAAANYRLARRQGILSNPFDLQTTAAARL